MHAQFKSCGHDTFNHKFLTAGKYTYSHTILFSEDEDGGSPLFTYSDTSDDELTSGRKNVKRKKRMKKKA